MQLTEKARQADPKLTQRAAHMQVLTSNKSLKERYDKAHKISLQ